MARERCHMETINDLHGGLVNLARVVASNRYHELHGRLLCTLSCEALFDEAKARCAEPLPVAPSFDAVEDEHLEHAYLYMVMSWQARNGSAGTKQGNVTLARRYTSNGGAGGFRWRSAVSSVPAWHERLRGVNIVQEDVMEFSAKIEDKDRVVYYLDPPYIRKGQKYAHDFTQEVSVKEALADGNGEKEGKRNDHVRLAIRLQRFQRTRVVVSYYDEPELDLLYPGWTKRKLNATKGLVNAGQRGKGAVKAPEVLLINGPSYAETKGRLF
jgi:DNA adenine methylase